MMGCHPDDLRQGAVIQRLEKTIAILKEANAGLAKQLNEQHDAKRLRNALLQLYSVVDPDSETKPALDLAWEALYPTNAKQTTTAKS